MLVSGQAGSNDRKKTIGLKSRWTVLLKKKTGFCLSRSYSYYYLAEWEPEPNSGPRSEAKRVGGLLYQSKQVHFNTVNNIQYKLGALQIRFLFNKLYINWLFLKYVLCTIVVNWRLNIIQYFIYIKVKEIQIF